MKSILIKKHGDRNDFQDIIYEETDLAKQTPQPERQKGQIIIKVLACSLAPGDVRTLSGKTKFVQVPKGGYPNDDGSKGTFPYIPGGDVCGIVTESDPDVSDSNKPEVGDSVIARFHGMAPCGGMAEFYAAKSALVSKVNLPDLQLTPVQAAALPASVVVAVRVARTWVKRGDRVLLLGATGGVGSHLVQILKKYGAEFVCGVCSKGERLEKEVQRGTVDCVVEYGEFGEKHQDDNHLNAHDDRAKETASIACATSIWDGIVTRCNHSKTRKFDLVVDTAAFPDAWSVGVLKKEIVKSSDQGGRFITTAGDVASYPVLGICDILRLMKRMLGRQVWRSMRCGHNEPQYSWWMGGLDEPIETEVWSEMFGLIKSKDLEVKIDPTGPFPFTEEGVRDAFRLQETRHAWGKVVVEVGK